MRRIKGIPVSLLMLLISCLIGYMVIRMDLINHVEQSLGWTGFLMVTLLASFSCLLDEGLSTGAGFALMTLALSNPDEIWLYVSIAASCFIFIYIASGSGITDKETIIGALKAVLVYEIVKIFAYFSFKIRGFSLAYLYPLIGSISFEVLITLIAFPLTIAVATKVYTGLKSSSEAASKKL